MTEQQDWFEFSATQPGRMSRRRFLATCSSIAAGTAAVPNVVSGAELTAAQNQRVRGLLIGGLLGDALGGPVEFGSGPDVDAVLPNTRNWPNDRRWNNEEARKLANSLTMLDYRKLRPDTASYGPWVTSAPAGTVTDDSRHKMVLLRTLATAVKNQKWPVDVKSLAQHYIDFQPHPKRTPNKATAELCEEGFREYVYAARWILGERDLSRAKPVARLWSGIATCSGQMMLPPLAAVFPGEPERAYRQAFELNFIDSPLAKDFASALVAGLSAVLDEKLDSVSIPQRWNILLKTMRNTDPYQFGAVPFAGRPLHKWLDLAEKIARESNGRPAELFGRLESDGKPVYWWDAHFTLLVPLAILQFCNFHPLASLQMCLDFRHDTDSYAQVAGCLIGAVEGASVFPERIVAPLLSAVEKEYGIKIDAWEATLSRCRRMG